MISILEGNNILNVQLQPIVPETWLEQLLKATSLAQIEAIGTEFDEAYRTRKITYAEYKELMLVYTRRSFWIDLNRRGGKWVQAAQEYWALTASVTDSTQLYSIYLEIYNRYRSA